MCIKGTALKGVFSFKKAVLSRGIMRWHISKTKIECSEIEPDEKRILINYTIEGKNVKEYKYYMNEDVYSAIFEIQQLSAPISTLKISDVLKIFITNKNPNVIHVHIVDRDGDTTRSKIQTQINPHVVINVPPDIYQPAPVNLEPEKFHKFMKVLQNNSKGSDKKVVVKIQSPDYISFALEKDDDPPQTHGIFKKKKESYEASYFIHELKHILKLSSSSTTSILNIYQPKTECDAPLYVRGNIKSIGEFNVYIHRSDVEPMQENDI